MQPDGSSDTPVDLSGLHNVTQRPDTSSVDESPPNPSESPPPAEVPEEKKAAVEDQQMIFAETLSLNSVTTDG